MSDLKLPPVNRPSLGERLPVWGVVAIVAVMLVVLAGGAVLVRGTQAQAPTPMPTGIATAVVSASPTVPINDWVDPETVTRSFIAAWEDARSHPKDVSNVMPFLLPGYSDVVNDVKGWAKYLVDHKMGFVAADVAVTDCVTADGPAIKRAAGLPTPPANLVLKHVVCQVSDTGQDTDLTGVPVGTHDPVWTYALVTEVQQFNGLWYVEAWSTCEHGQSCGLLGNV